VDKRSRKVYWLWGASLGVLVVIGMLSWFLVIPMRKVREVAGDYMYRKYDEKEAIAALGGPEKAYPMLRLFLKLPVSLAEGGREERAGAAKLLIRYNRPPVEWLVELLNDEDREVCGRAAKALRMQAQWANGDQSKTAEALACRRSLIRYLPALISGLDNRNSLVRREACLTLAELGPESLPALPRLKELLASREYGVPGAALVAACQIGADQSQVVTCLIKALKNGDVGVKIEAAKRLQWMGPSAKEAIPALEAALGDANAYVRERSIHALRDIGPAADTVVPALIGVLNDQERDVRRYAAFTLGHFGPKAIAARPALEKLSSDEEPHVRQAATEALKKIKAAQEKK